MILYGTYDDPNRHLDPISAPATLQQTTNSPTAPTFTLEPHHSKHSSTIPPPASPAQSGIQTSTGLLSKPISSFPSPSPPPPPPPLQPPLNQNPTEHTFAAYNHQQNNNRPWHYSSQASPPPPLPPVTSVPPKISSTSAHPPTITTTSSYVTTFKTIVSTSSSSPTSTSTSTSSSPPPPPPPSLASDQQAQGNNGPVRAQIDQSGQIIKADFEVVPPPSLAATPTTNFNFQQHHQQTDPRFRPTQGEHGAHPFNTSFDKNNVAQFKPPVIQIDGNKIDTPTLLTSKQTLTQHDYPNNNTINNNNNNNNNGNNNLNGGQQNQHELDGNQIDSKLTKDYRSSGDQSSNYLSANTKTITTNDLNVDSANKVQTKLKDEQNSSANSSTKPNFALFCLLALIEVVFSSSFPWPLFDYLVFANSIHVVRL